MPTKKTLVLLTASLLASPVVATKKAESSQLFQSVQLVSQQYTQDEVESAVIEILEEQLRVSDVFLNSRIIGDLGADSLDAVELIMQVEERFDIAIPDEEAENIVTVQQLIQLIMHKLGNRLS